MLSHCCLLSAPLNQAVLLLVRNLSMNALSFAFSLHLLVSQCHHRALAEGFPHLPVQLHQVHASCECVLLFCADSVINHL